MQKGMVHLTWSSVKAGKVVSLFLASKHIYTNEMLIDFSFLLILRLLGRAEGTADSHCHCNPRYPLSSGRSTLFTLYLLNTVVRQQSQLQNPRFSKSSHLASEFCGFFWREEKTGKKLSSGDFYIPLFNRSFLFERRCSSVSSERAHDSDVLSAGTVLMKEQ